jgi:replicative DNA helicase
MMNKLFEKLPPQNTEAEMCVLGSMLIDPDEAALIALDMLKESDFYLPGHRLIFKNIAELFKAKVPADLIMLRDAFEKTGELEKIGGTEYLNAIVESVPTAFNCKDYADIVKRDSLLRRIIEMCNNVNRACYEGEMHPDDILARLSKTINHIERPIDTFAPMFDDIKAARERINEIERLRQEGRPVCDVITGIAPLDDMIFFEPGTLVLIAARPSMGKTTWALNILIQNAIRGVSGAFFSLEMSREQIAQNTLISIAQVNSSKMKRGFMTAADHVSLDEAVDKAAAFKSIWTAPIRLKMNELRLLTRTAVQKHGCKYIILDYLQLADGEGNDERMRANFISKTLKMIAREFQIPVLALCQLSRKPEEREDHRPRMSDLKESGNLEQDADIILGLFRPGYYDRGEYYRHLLEIKPLKNRVGEGDAVLVYYEMSKYHISEIPADFLQGYHSPWVNPK